eukprot:2045428-Prymnesium_polylepis.1
MQHRQERQAKGVDCKEEDGHIASSVCGRRQLLGKLTRVTQEADKQWSEGSETWANGSTANEDW